MHVHQKAVIKVKIHSEYVFSIPFSTETSVLFCGCFDCLILKYQGDKCFALGERTVWMSYFAFSSWIRHFTSCTGLKIIFATSPWSSSKPFALNIYNSVLSSLIVCIGLASSPVCNNVLKHTLSCMSEFIFLSAHIYPANGLNSLHFCCFCLCYFFHHIPMSHYHILPLVNHCFV